MTLPCYYSIPLSMNYCTQFGFFIPYLSQEEKGDQWLCKKPLLCISVALSGRELCNIFPKSFSFRYFSHPYMAIYCFENLWFIYHVKLAKSECIQGICALHIRSFPVYTCLSGEHLIHLPLQSVCPC